MEIAESKDGEVHVLAPKGSLNTQTSPKLEQKLNALLGAKARLLVIDFKGVDYLSSAALRVLLMITRRLVRAHGRLVLCAMSADLKKVFSISGFDKDFTILDSRVEAVALAASTPPPPSGGDKAARKGARAPEASKADAAPEPADALPAPAAGGAPGWPFLQAGAKPRAETAAAPEPEPPAAAVAAPAGEASRAAAGPDPARVASLLAAGDDSPPWAGWGASAAPEGLAARVSRILGTSV